MKYNRFETPAYLIWVEQRPSMSTKSKGKQLYFDAVRVAAQRAIASPIKTNDIEIEIVYATNQKKEERKDTDNVNKPTLDALKGVAYGDDSQVRSVTCTVFDRNLSSTVNGRVEHIGRLFYSNKPHVILIMIYSDSRLQELGGEHEVQRLRYLEWQKNFDEMVSQIKKRTKS
jgi:Holliday junction resolvase RusA-like endonuclease